ncbi:GL15171 [Drosophila persimilis]|uniref:GL15171 n=1 Tax=Drosophila persimilis TaxID=7234 RepID=B4H3P0_DROPE|nr:uncharacterized protein LOC6600381 [Drosophila persimilis]EDW30991.1 GL15171 [Drosophila persimilis]
MSCEEASGDKAVDQHPNMHQAIVGLVEHAKRLKMLTVDGIGAEWSASVGRPTSSGQGWRGPALPSRFVKRNRKFETKMLRLLRRWDSDREATTKPPAPPPSQQSLANALKLTSNMIESYKTSEILVDKLIGDSLSLYSNLVTQTQMHRNIQLIQQLEIETNDRILDQLHIDFDLEYESGNVLANPRSYLQPFQCPSCSKGFPEQKSVGIQTQEHYYLPSLRGQDGALVVAAIVNMDHPEGDSSQGGSNNSMEEIVQGLKGISNFCQIMTNYNDRFKHNKSVLTCGDVSKADTQLLQDKIRVRCQLNIYFYKMMIIAESELMNQLPHKEAAIGTGGAGADAGAGAWDESCGDGQAKM